MENIWHELDGVEAPMRDAGTPMGEVQYTPCIDLSHNFVENPEPEETPAAPRRKGGPKRSKNFTSTEDETLCSAYLNVSKDPIVGVNQSMTSYWARITQYYNENKKTPTTRTLSSLQHRWGDIQKDTSRFCGFYAEIERLNRSGKSEDDKVKDALQMYEGIIKSPYKFLHCWFILRKEHKWNTFVDNISAPNDSTAGQGPEPSKDDTLPEKIERPIGRDKAKKQRSSSMSSNSSACIEVLQKIQLDRQAYTARVEASSNAYEVANQIRSDRKLAIQEQQLKIQEKMLRVQQEQQENLVMTLDLDKMSPWVREYYICRQKEIAAKRSAGEGPSGGV